MKKIALLLTLIFTFTLLSTSFASAEDVKIRVVVNGRKINFPDAQPFVDAQGRTQVPSRFIAEALGASTTWNAKEQKASFELEKNKLVLTIGQSKYLLNGGTYRMDTVAIVKNARTYVPARYVAQAFGAEVKWDKAVRTVYIQTNTTGEVTPAPELVPEGGTTKKYGGISFNDVTDVDQYGRMTKEKSIEFLQKLASQITFVKENGKYVIKCTYPKLPSEFVWSVGITVETGVEGDNWSGLVESKLSHIPLTGSFTREVPFIKNAKDVELYSMSLTINPIDRSKLDGNDGSPGLLAINKTREEQSAGYVPRTGPSQYFKDFNFGKMFQW
ncbi:hypothetical protein J2T13_001441 [Paenibacillus sp. DS2015]|uniref:copper amine oxidase N-terminal domain-containing protein n=1 Tax=Paenibacillus sp. DS2015 TaxID=3373917 RepID=UPI003D1AD591